MSLKIIFPILFCAALLEAAADALVRSGLHAHALATRVLLLFAGAVVLFGYACAVNSPPWDFGRLIGVYVVFFFLAAQLISWLFFHQRPSAAILLGGAFILTGGAIISVASLQ